MEIAELKPEDYDSIFNKPCHIFNTAAFNDLNKYKCDEVKYLAFKDSKYRLGFVGGVKNNLLISPFSAPFGGFSFVKGDIQIAQIEKAVSSLEQYAIDNHMDGIQVALPPPFYNETFLAKVLNTLYRNNYAIANMDLDFYMNLENMENYSEKIWYNAKKNLQIASRQDFKFEVCNTNDEKVKEVYQIIAENRKSRDKPLNMSYSDIINTSGVVPTDFFLLSKDGHGIASAIVFHVNDTTAYVPFWGDRPGFLNLKPMNFISFKTFEHYKSISKKHVHIGISTESSIPNYGLCEFKESLGCTITPKITFKKLFINHEK